MSKVDELQAQIDKYKRVLDSLPELQQKIRTIKKDYEETIASKLCDIVALGATMDDVFQPQLQYEVCASTLRKLEAAAAFANTQVNQLSEQLSQQTSFEASQRVKDDVKDITEQLQADPYNLKLKVKYIQYAKDYLNLNKAEAAKRAEQIVKDGITLQD